jgi:molybdopterin-guanine dinucleotide biosynthesis protein A
VIVGIFVGGRSTRMGRTKALLPSPEGGTLLARSVDVVRAIGGEPVLVGRRDDVPAIVRVLDDAAPGRGPLGGLVALLDHARGPVIALACDMPFVTAPLLARLASAPPSTATAPRIEGRWEPLFARYDVSALPMARARLEAGALAMHGLLDALAATELEVTREERAQLTDWDEPADVERTRAAKR